MDTITETIEIDVPVRTAYDQWTQFEATGAWRGEIRDGSVTTVDAESPRNFNTRSIGSSAR